MPTKEAVKTSILSTRWKNIWASIPTIDFDDDLLDAMKVDDDSHCPDVTSFMNFVERVLRLRDASNMKKFCLSYEDYAEKLFSGCSVLENLVLSDCMWMHVEDIVISISTLKSLTIDDQSFLDPFDDFNGCKIRIDAPNLTYFEYIGFLSNEILLSNVPSLVKACIHISLPCERQKIVACRAIDLLKPLQYVMSLRLSNCTIEGFEHSVNLGENDRVWLLIPICVSNCLKTVTFKNFHANDSELCFLKHVLKYARVLERMNICWSKTPLRGQKKQTKVMKELETIERSSIACVVKFS
ncbi:hypothetical protein L2E82_25993 [Cichorium intybus]|uniref:Uncharacterized protein n=1 Tax=Cichorium intybus TaxID=13427 RepID=A0ACB9E5N4_CICIN|nr:hypothetical protein L2E82_25993 [Cichorium intybus]